MLDHRQHRGPGLRGGDRGPRARLSAEHRDEVNAALANPPPFDLSGSDQLGLFVAGQLAKRQNVKISLRPSPYGGTTAIVLIPHTLVIPEGSPATPSALPAGGSAFTPARHAIGGGFEPHGRGGARSGDAGCLRRRRGPGRLAGAGHPARVAGARASPGPLAAGDPSPGARQPGR